MASKSLKEIAAASDYRRTTQPVIDGWAVFQWPEFIAFAVRLGIPLDIDAKSMTIRIAIDEQPLITCEFSGREPHKKIDTTNAHTNTWRTFAVPVPTGDVDGK